MTPRIAAAILAEYTIRAFCLLLAGLAIILNDGHPSATEAEICVRLMRRAGGGKATLRQ